MASKDIMKEECYGGLEMDVVWRFMKTNGFKVEMYLYTMSHTNHK